MEMTLSEQIEAQVRTLPLDKQYEVLDFVTFLHERTQRKQTPASEMEQGRQIKEAFETLAKLQTFAGIVDPLAWQAEIRQDRPLPGRDV